MTNQTVPPIAIRPGAVTAGELAPMLTDAYQAGFNHGTRGLTPSFGVTGAELRVGNAYHLALDRAMNDGDAPVTAVRHFGAGYMAGLTDMERFEPQLPSAGEDQVPMLPEKSSSWSPLSIAALGAAAGSAATLAVGGGVVAAVLSGQANEGASPDASSEGPWSPEPQTQAWW